jgi:hypothetical protein
VGDGSDRLVRLLLLLVGALFLSIVSRADPDLWGHVRYGQDVLAEGRLPATATYTFTAADQPWINHENLAEIAFAGAMNAVGPAGLGIIRGVLGLAVMGLVLAAARRERVGLPATALTVVLVGWNLGCWWTARPQLFTNAGFAAMIFLLDRGGRWLALVPLLFVAWANAHGGFVAGLLLLALYLGCRGIEALVRDGRAAWPRVAALTTLGVVAALATLITPYGIEYAVWLFRDLSPPRPEISEWARLAPRHQQFVPFVLLSGLSAVAFATPGRPRDLTRIACLVVAASQAVLHLRHIPFFAILAGFWLPPQLDLLFGRLAARRAAAVPRAGAARPTRLPRAALVVAAVVLVVTLGAQLRRLRVDKAQYPVDAFAFMAAHQIAGRAVVYFDWSQYAIAAFAPRLTVAFDGRFRTCYPQDVADAHFDLILGDRPGRRWRSPSSAPFDPTRALEMGAPELVLLNRHVPYGPDVMRHAAGWVLLYQDELAELWGRRERYDDPRSPEFLPPERRAISDRPQRGFVLFPALPDGAERRASPL